MLVCLSSSGIHLQVSMTGVTCHINQTSRHRLQSMASFEPGRHGSLPERLICGSVNRNLDDVRVNHRLLLSDTLSGAVSWLCSSAVLLGRCSTYRPWKLARGHTARHLWCCSCQYSTARHARLARMMKAHMQAQLTPTWDGHGGDSGGKGEFNCMRFWTHRTTHQGHQ